MQVILETERLFLRKMTIDNSKVVEIIEVDPYVGFRTEGRKK